jgi:cysteine synthase A
MCRRLVRHGFLLGGSTGTVVQGAADWLADNDARADLTAVAISPDFGNHYLDTIYQDEWLRDAYGPQLLLSTNP